MLDSTQNSSGTGPERRAKGCDSANGAVPTKKKRDTDVHCRSRLQEQQERKQRDQLAD